MATETIYKLQPHRTLHLQGFDGYGCTASLHNASATGFTIDGIWGEQDDFVVLILWDADNQFEHPRIRYLPDTAFGGITLAFDLAVVNCVAIDSDYFPWIDWAFLNVTFADGTGQQVRLSDHATGSAYTPAACTFTLGGTVTSGDYVELAWLDQHFNYLLTGTDTPTSTMAALAASINSATATTGMSAVATGASIALQFVGVTGSLLGKGANGNRIGVYGTVHGAGTESWSPVSQQLAGGSSPATWSLSLAFSTVLSQTAVQKMWLTFAPPVASGVAFAGGVFSATVSSWAVTDAGLKRALSVAMPGSVRIEETDSWAVRSGYWEDAPADGFAFWSQGRAIRSAYSSTETRKLTIETHCQSTHDIYVGTRLDGNCGIVSASLDGGSPVTLDSYGLAAQVRRQLFAAASAGQHSVTITISSSKNALSSGWYFYFDFLECAVRGDVPDAPATRTDVAVAADYDTDNAYKLPPQRLLWAIQRMGLVGEVDHYSGVFWWPARKMLTAPATCSQQSVVTFSGPPSFGTTTSLTLGGTTINHTNLIGDTAATVALAFKLLINQGSTVFWATVSGAALTLHGLAGSANYHIAVSVNTHDVGFTASVVTTNGSAVAVEWGVDDTATSPVNSAVTPWYADYFAGLVAAGMGVVVSFGQELVNPPAAWVQSFADGTAVATATGFGTLNSSQCTFSAAVQAYMAAAYAQMAGLMVAGGIAAPRLQFGEVGWWFQSGGSPLSMAFYDADTAAAATAALGRSLASFVTPNDNPNVNSFADANFLRTRLANYVSGVQAAILAIVATAVFELLWPLDVNDPTTARLLRYVNLPTAWQTRSGSGFDTFLVEGFQYAGINHNIDKALTCATYPFAVLSWDQAHCRYLMGWYYSGWPWQAEYLRAQNAGVSVIKAWAWDHLNLFAWPLPLPVNPARALVF